MDISIDIFDISKRYLKAPYKEQLITPETGTMTPTNMGDYNLSAMETSFRMNETYHVVWTPDVIFRVSTITVLMILTLIGNVSLIMMILCHRKLRKRRVNIFLVNLALGDIMVCLVTMTTEIVFVAFGEWILGAVACKLTVYGQMVTLASTTFLLTAMSIDRFQVIVRPLKSLRGQPQVWHKVIVGWIMAFIFATPQLFIFVQTSEGLNADGSIRHMCRSQGYQPGQTWQRKIYFSFLAGYILVIPTIIMTFCYANIIRVVFMRAGDNAGPPKLRFTSSRRSSASFVRRNSSDSQSEHEMTSSGNPCRRIVAPNMTRINIPKKLISSSKRNVVKMTLSVILAFILCWSPYFIIGLIRIFTDYKIRLDLLYSTAEILAMLHSALNPILYGAFSTKSAIKTFKSTSCFFRKKSTEKIVVNISVGSDFDSLVFVTHPELYTGRLSTTEQTSAQTCGCLCSIKKFCGSTKQNGASTVGTTKYKSISVCKGESNKPESGKKTSSLRSQQSNDSSSVFVSSNTQCTQTSSLSALSCDQTDESCDRAAITARGNRFAARRALSNNSRGSNKRSKLSSQRSCDLHDIGNTSTPEIQGKYLRQQFQASHSKGLLAK